MNVPPKLLKNSKFGGTFRCSIFLYLADCQCDALSVQRFFHRVHGVGLGFFGDVDVWLHGFVIGLGVSTHPQANTGTFHLFCQLSQRTHTD